MIKWPNGYEYFYKKVAEAAPVLLDGILVAIDPASVSPGYAVFKAGKLEQSGIVELPKKATIKERLAVLHAAVRAFPATVLGIEMIRGSRAHVYLHWSVGVSVAASRAPILLEVPVAVWKAVAKCDTTYTKGDEADAIKIGECLILLAKGVLSVDSKFRTKWLDSNTDPDSGIDPTGRCLEVI